MTLLRCFWCDVPMIPGRRGSPRRFCSTAHRLAFWSALRKWGMRAVAAGLITADNLRAPLPVAGDAQLPPGGTPPALLQIAVEKV